MTHPQFLAALYNPALPGPIGGNPNGQPGGTALSSLVRGLVGALLVGGFLLAFVFLLTGAVGWISSGGDKAKLEKARDQITNAIIGIVILASAWAIAQLVARFFGLNLKALTLPAIGP